MAPEPIDDAVLHLFSSDYRPLYLQDCLEVLAVPAGSVHRFRYDRTWLYMNGQDETVAWNLLASESRKVLVYFYAQTTKRYGERIFVPLRWGKVLRSFVEGDSHFVDFEVGSYVDPTQFRAFEDSRTYSVESLRKADNGATASGFKTRRGTASDVTASLVSLLQGHNPITSNSLAVLGRPPFLGGDGGDRTESEAFQRLTTILHDLVGLRAARDEDQGEVGSFFRVVSIKTARRGEIVPVNEGILKVRRGLSYEIRTFHLNTAGAVAKISVALPDSISATTPPNVDIDGSYDVRDFGFSPKAHETDAIGQIELSSATPFSWGGANARDYRTTIHMPVLSVPRTPFLFWSWFIAVATGLAAFPIALNALSAIRLAPAKDPDGYWDWSWLVHFLDKDAYLGIAAGAVLPAAITASAAFIIALGALFRRRWGLSPA